MISNDSRCFIIQLGSSQTKLEEILKNGSEDIYAADFDMSENMLIVSTF